MSGNSVQGKSLKSLIEPFLMPVLAVILPSDAHSSPHRKQDEFAAPNTHFTPAAGSAELQRSALPFAVDVTSHPAARIQELPHFCTYIL